MYLLQILILSAKKGLELVDPDQQHLEDYKK